MIHTILLDNGQHDWHQNDWFWVTFTNTVDEDTGKVVNFIYWVSEAFDNIEDCGGGYTFLITGKVLNNDCSHYYRKDKCIPNIDIIKIKESKDSIDNKFDNNQWIASDLERIKVNKIIVDRLTISMYNLTRI